MVLIPRHQHTLLPVIGPLRKHLFFIPHDSEASTTGLYVAVVAVKWGTE